MDAPRTTFSGLPPPPDPPQGRYRRPPATAELLLLVQVLLVYARHLIDLLNQAAERGCLLLARCFGTAQAGFVLTSLSRGILRAIALERVLLAPAGGQPAGGQPAGGQPATGERDPDRTPRTRIACATQPSGPRPPRHPQDRCPGLPTLRQLEAAIRRQPVEAAIDDIRHDLGVCFSLCEARFGSALHDMAAGYRDTLANAFHPIPRRDMAVADAPSGSPPLPCHHRNPMPFATSWAGLLARSSPSVVSLSPLRRLARQAREPSRPDPARRFSLCV